MINFNNYLKFTIITYLFISIIIWIKKPRLIFNDKSNLKQFGIGKSKTIFYYPFVIIVLSIIIYFIYFSLYLRNGLK